MWQLLERAAKIRQTTVGHDRTAIVAFVTRDATLRRIPELLHARLEITTQLFGRAIDLFADRVVDRLGEKLVLMKKARHVTELVNDTQVHAVLIVQDQSRPTHVVEIKKDKSLIGAIARSRKTEEVL